MTAVAQVRGTGIHKIDVHLHTSPDLIPVFENWAKSQIPIQIMLHTPRDVPKGFIMSTAEGMRFVEACCHVDRDAQVKREGHHPLRVVVQYGTQEHVYTLVPNYDPWPNYNAFVRPCD